MSGNNGVSNVQNNHALFTFRVSTPCDLPAGAVALLFGDSPIPLVCEGPRPLTSTTTPVAGANVLLFPSREVTLRCDVDGLHSADGVGLGLTVQLSLRLADPLRAYGDFIREAAQFSHDELSALLCDTLRQILVPSFGDQSVTDFWRQRDLRAGLVSSIQNALGGAYDLKGRSGLEVISLQAGDLHCELFDPDTRRREQRYFPNALLSLVSTGILLDEAVIARLGQVGCQAGLPSDGMGSAPELPNEPKTRNWGDRLAGLRSTPSTLRPELWRLALREKVQTSPLVDDKNVYVATITGRVMAYAREDGSPVWQQPAQLGTKVGDGLTLAGGLLWVPGYDGTLYGLQTTDGTVRYHPYLGGRLSSAPLLVGNLLFQSVDIDADNQRPGGGQIAAVRVGDGVVTRQWQVSSRGLRGHPAQLGDVLFFTDRSGSLYSFHTHSGHVDQLPLHCARIVAAPLVDYQRHHVIVGDMYGMLLALESTGRERWSFRMGGAMVGQPTIHQGILFAGCSDGRLYALDPATGIETRPPFKTRGPIATPPIGWGHLVFIGSNDGFVYAVEADTGACFWQYNSCSPVTVSPAIGKEGQVYAVDNEGHLNALYWCLTRYAEGAQRMQKENPPNWNEAIELWLLAGEVQEALDTAQKAGRLDLVAELAANLSWYSKAAETCEVLTRSAHTSQQAAEWWTRAADSWELAGDADRSKKCRLSAANACGKPLLTMRQINLPNLTPGNGDEMQVRIENLTDVLARDIVLSYEGHVQRPGSRSVASLGPLSQQVVKIEVVCSASGSALLHLTLCYKDIKGQPQPPSRLELRLKVNQPAVNQNYYQGPVVGPNGVMIWRQGFPMAGQGTNQTSDQASLEPPPLPAVPCAHSTAQPGNSHCPECGVALPVPNQVHIPLKPVDCKHTGIVPGSKFCPDCGAELNAEGS